MWWFTFFAYYLLIRAKRADDADDMMRPRLFPFFSSHSLSPEKAFLLSTPNPHHLLNDIFFRFEDCQECIKISSSSSSFSMHSHSCKADNRYLRHRNHLSLPHSITMLMMSSSYVAKETRKTTNLHHDKQSSCFNLSCLIRITVKKTTSLQLVDHQVA